MIDAVIKWALEHRLTVVVASVVMLLWGTWQATQMPVDVLPDLAAPTVNVVVEAQGMAPEEVESTVVQPVEARMTSATGVRRVRSHTSVGSAIIDVEFDWDVEIEEARRIVAEQLQVANAELPPGVDPPVMGPVASVMGEIMFIALTSSGDHTPEELRDTAEWLVGPRISSVPGVAEVQSIGGAVKQYEVVVHPGEMATADVDISQVLDAIRDTDQNISAGFFEEFDQEYLIYGLGRIHTAQDIKDTLVIRRGQDSIRVGDIAEVRVGSALIRGDASFNGEQAVIIGIQKQPDANTLALTETLDGVLDEVDVALAEGIGLERDLFRQSDFIEVAVDNVQNALLAGSILVVLIIFFFLGKVRATLIAAIVIPLSLVVSAMVLRSTGGTINTMTLGGMAIAVGVLVDDAIVVVENIVRRLQLNSQNAQGSAAVSTVVAAATREVVSPLYYANLVVFLVLLPLLFLTGMEGRLLRPLAVAFIVAVIASLVIALTVTPALCSFALSTDDDGAGPDKDSLVVAWLKRIYEPVLDATLLRWRPLAFLSVALVMGAAALLGSAGQSFLPEFNEGSLTVNANTLPGTSLETADELGRWVEEVLHRHPEVISTARRTGRGEQDAHAQASQASEIDVTLELGDRSREEFIDALRDDLSQIPSVNIGIDQPISHRIDHMFTGAQASVAIRIVGDDLHELRRLAERVSHTVGSFDGVVDLNIEDQTDIPYLLIDKDRSQIARQGLDMAAVTQALQTAYLGSVVGQVMKGERRYNLVVRYPDSASEHIDQIRQTKISGPDGQRLPLEEIADIRRDLRPGEISRQDGRRQITLSFNLTDTDVVGAVEEVRRTIDDDIDFPEGYYAEFAGQYQRAGETTQTLVILGLIALIGIFLAMASSLRSSRDAVLVLLNLPLALIGGVAGIFFLDGVLSVASVVGFITLFGIATRNGLLLICHIRHLHLREGVDDIAQAVRRGAMERLSPILMTALASGLGLLPLAMQSGAPGGEIQGPMAVVILFGLISSTLLTLLVLPALYLRFGQLTISPVAAQRGSPTDQMGQ